jgi:hypothetical protein
LSCGIPNDWLPIPTDGFSEFENGKVVHIWAIDQKAALSIPQIPGDGDSRFLSFDLSSLNARSVAITEPDGKIQTFTLVPGQSQHVEIRLFHLQPETVVKFQTDTAWVKPDNGDIRTLFFDVSNLRLQ